MLQDVDEPTGGRIASDDDWTSTAALHGGGAVIQCQFAILLVGRVVAGVAVLD